MNIAELYKIFLENRQISTDTRFLNPGCLFFALKGDSFDGNKFAGTALKKGASFAVIDDPSFQTSGTILVEDVLRTLQHLATIHINTLKPSLRVIGLTGSNGKTTTKEILFKTLSQKYKVQATAGNLNNHIGVPLTCLSIKDETDIAIIEMGANHQGEIKSLSQIACPDLGLITNIGSAHLEGFGGPEGVLKGKSELFAYINQERNHIFINGNQPRLVEKSVEYNCKKSFFGSHPQSMVDGQVSNESLPYLSVEIRIKNTNRKRLVHTQLTGEYNLDNILAAFAIGITFQVTPEKIASAIENYAPENNRSQFIKSAKNEIILDAYNANPTSMEAALKNLNRFNAKKKILILGEMKELGVYSREAHEKMLKISLDIENVNNIFVLGKDFTDSPMAKENKSIKAFGNVDEMMEYLKKSPPEDCLIFIKGSRSNNLEKIVPLIP